MGSRQVSNWRLEPGKTGFCHYPLIYMIQQWIITRPHNTVMADHASASVISPGHFSGKRTVSWLLTAKWHRGGWTEEVSLTHVVTQSFIPTCSPICFIYHQFAS